jgi:hypothetical protein
MSQHPASPEQPEPEEGHFVGGDFGTSDNAEDDQLSTAQEIEADEDRPAYLADPLHADPEFVTEPSEPGSLDTDVEGTSTEPAPGDRNEPV